jgi:hypothetical protein
MNWLSAVSAFKNITVVKDKNLFGSSLISKPGNILFTAKKISAKSHLFCLVATR